MRLVLGYLVGVFPQVIPTTWVLLGGQEALSRELAYRTGVPKQQWREVTMRFCRYIQV